MQTNSPRRTSRLISASAWVSTSSVRKTFLMASRWISVFWLVVIVSSIQPDSFEGIPLRHIRQDDLVADLQALQDFDGTDRTTAQLDLHTRCRPAAFGNSEQADQALRLALHRAADIQDILEPLQLDSSIDTQVGTRPFGQWSI